MFLKNESEILFQRYKAERINYQQICGIRDVKGTPSRGRKMIPDRNADLQIGIKGTGTANCIGKCMAFLFLLTF